VSEKPIGSVRAGLVETRNGTGFSGHHNSHLNFENFTNVAYFLKRFISLGCAQERIASFVLLY
jgi:hypothetical protein